MQTAPEVVEFTLPFWRKNRSKIFFGFAFYCFVSYRLIASFVGVAVGRYQPVGIDLAFWVVTLVGLLWIAQDTVRQLRVDWWDPGVDIRIDVEGMKLRDRQGQVQIVGWNEIRYIDQKASIVNYECSAGARGWCELPVIKPQMRAAERDRIWAAIKFNWPILHESWQHQLVKRQHLDFPASTLTSGSNP